MDNQILPINCNKVILKQQCSESELEQLLNAQQYYDSLIIDSYLTDIELIDSIKNIQKLNQLIHLTINLLNKVLIQEKSLIVVAESISKLTQLKSLKFNIIYCGVKQFVEFSKEFGNALKKLNSLESLHLVNQQLCEFGIEGVQYLNQGIMSLNNLKRLRIEEIFSKEQSNHFILQVLLKDIDILNQLKDVQIIYLDTEVRKEEEYLQQLKKTITSISQLSQFELSITICRTLVNEFQDFFDGLLSMNNLKKLKINLFLDVDKQGFHIKLFQNAKTLSRIENLDIMINNISFFSKQINRLSIDFEGVLNLQNLRQFAIKTSLLINSFELQKIFGLLIQQKKILSYLMLNSFGKHVNDYQLGEKLNELTCLKQLILDLNYQHCDTNKIGIIEAISQMKELEVLLIKGELDKLTLSQNGLVKCFRQLQKLKVLKVICGQTEQASRMYIMIAQSFEQLPNLKELELTNDSKNTSLCFNKVCESFSNLQNLQILKLNYEVNLFSQYPDIINLSNIRSLSNLLQLNLRFRLKQNESESFCNLLKSVLPSLKKLIIVNFSMECGYIYDSRRIIMILIKKSIKLVEKCID